MPTALKMEIDPEKIVQAAKRMKKQDREDFIENLLAATRPEYPESIREARANYQAGHTFGRKDLFGQ